MPLLLGPIVALLLASTTVLLTPARQATPPPDPALIPPVVWELRSIETNDATVDVGGPAAYTVQFLPDGMLGVRADCNLGSGLYLVGGGTIEVGPIRTTRMRCPPGSIDQTFLQGLGAAVSWSFRDDRLWLESASLAETLVFAPRLTGVVWEWQDFEGGSDRGIVPADPADYAIEFLADGRFALAADCNGGGGPYATDGPSIGLQLAVITEAVCDSPATDRAFLQVIAEASSFVFGNGVLYLALPADAGIARFTARPLAPESAATPAVG